MNDRKKVIKEAEEAIDILAKAEEPTFWMDFVRCAFENALALLKEQEQEKNVYTWICPKCGSQIILKAYKADKAIGMSFDCCPVCGKDVLYGKVD